MKIHHSKFKISHPKHGELIISEINWSMALSNAWRRLVGHHRPPTVCGINNLHAHWNACETLDDYEQFNRNLLDDGWKVEKLNATT